MLSYRHSYHAGNFADVLKHSVQSLIIEALKQKPKAFVYQDTHSAAGRYHLKDSHGEKTGEYREGIARLWLRKDLPTLLEPYLQTVRQLNPNGELAYYPGSPKIARLLMGQEDKLELTELHPTDYKLLQQEFARDKKVRIQQMDGYQGLKAMLPPPQRRGLVLIDPPYEIKTEYQQAVQGIKQGYKRFATGIYALWYPVLTRSQVNNLCEDLAGQGIRKILRIESCVAGDTPGRGMTGSGMLVVNPPWKLYEQMQELLPWLTQELRQDDGAHWTLEWLVEE